MNRDILRLAFPNIISNLSVPLLGIADTVLMGRLESPAYLGAVGLGGSIFGFLYWGFGFLRMGTTGLTAQAFGQGSAAAQTRILGQALTVALLGSLLLLLLQVPLGALLMRLLPASPEVMTYTREYFFIRIFAAPATISLYAFHGWFLGMQNARYPMLLAIFVNLVNIGLNALFVLRLGMASDGVAWATVIAQYSGLLLAIGLLFLHYRDHLRAPDWRSWLETEALKRFFSVNADIFVRTMCLLFTLGFFQFWAAGINDTVLAANQVLMQYFHTMAFAVDGFAYAAESLVGRFHGARQPARMRLAIRWLFIWGLGLGAVFSIAYALAGEPLLRVFTDQPEIIDTARAYLPWMTAFPLVGAWAFMWDGIYIGATATRAMRNSMLLATFGLFLPVFFVGRELLSWGENHVLWLALTLFMLARGALLTLLAEKSIFFSRA